MGLVGCGGYLIGLALIARRPHIAFDGFRLVEADLFGVSLDEAAIEDAARQSLVVVRFDCFEIADGDSRLIRDLAQSDAARLTCESQLFSERGCHHQSASVNSGLIRQ